MSDSSNYSDMSDLDDIADIDLFMQLEHQQMQVESSRRSCKEINRERDVAEARLMTDYFGPSPKYSDYYFRRRYRLMGFSVIMKCTSTICQLTYGTSPDAFDEYLQMGKHCARDSDGIYPQWASFVKSFTVARDERNGVFKRRQESAQKDVERDFGVLQGRWHIIAQPARSWTVNKLRRIMYTCIILHNMILKNQKFALSDIGDTYICPRANLARSWIERCEVQRKQEKEIRDKQTHARLQRNLIEHCLATTSTK
ncbi:ALP1-like protein isoform X1 [Tanacetum coccineum]